MLEITYSKKKKKFSELTKTYLALIRDEYRKDWLDKFGKTSSLFQTVMIHGMKN